MIELKNVSAGYKNSKEILTDISYTFFPGSVYVIAGENGSGKTTLSKVILGLLKPTVGKVNIAPGMVISYLPDHDGLYQDMTVMENIIFRLGLYEQKFDEDKVLAVLKKYNLEIYKDYKVKELSLGTKRKTALICSSLVDWQLLVMDEPISGIDVDGKAELANMIEAIDINNRILIIITHDFDFLDKVSYHKLIIRDGQLHEDSCS